LSAIARPEPAAEAPTGDWRFHLRAFWAARPRPHWPEGWAGSWGVDLRRRLGGVIGHHGRQGQASGIDLWVFALATVTWMVLMVRQLPCRQGNINQAVDTYTSMCYSDIGILYRVRGMGTGASLYTDIDWEYPVLSGFFAEVARRLTDLIGFRAAPDLDPAQVLTNANVYFAVSAVLLFACFLGVVAVQRRLMGSQPWAVLALAVSPAIMTSGLINWDLWAILLTSLGLLAWTRQKPVWAGIWLGLGVAAKFYPLVLLGGLFVWAWRSDRLRAWLRLAGAAVLTWLVVNLPLMMVDFPAWSHFYTYNRHRPPDLGSLWYALDLVDLPAPSAQTWALVLMVLCYAGIALITLTAPVTPRVGQIAYLCVAVMVAFNLVYSPQYVLWTLPLIIWARPHWPDLLVYTVSELGYFLAVWLYLAGDLFPADGGPPRLYVVAVFLRVGVTGWLMARVIRDILVVQADPLRAERPLTGRRLSWAGHRPSWVVSTLWSPSDPVLSLSPASFSSASLDPASSNRAALTDTSRPAPATAMAAASRATATWAVAPTSQVVYGPVDRTTTTDRPDPAGLSDATGPARTGDCRSAAENAGPNSGTTASAAPAGLSDGPTTGATVTALAASAEPSDAAGNAGPASGKTGRPAPRTAAVRKPLFNPRWAVSVTVVGWLFSRVTLIFAAIVIGSSYGRSGLDSLVQWDAVHFINLSEQGYPTDDVTKAAFFPGLPLLIAAGRLVGLSSVTAGFLISLLASAVVAWGLFRLAGGGVAGAVAAGAWSFAPMAVFTIVPYSESLFLAFAIWAWVKARSEHWLQAGLLAAAAGLTRVSGVFLVGALALLAVWGFGRIDWVRVRRRLAWLSLPLLSIFSYVLYLRFHYGHWDTWLQAQRIGWGRSFHWPWEALRTTMCAAGWLNQPDAAGQPCSAGYDPGNAGIFSGEILAVALGLAIAAICLWRRRIGEGGWVGAQVLAFSCQVWFISVARAVLLWFPLWTTLGEVAGAKWRGRARWARLVFFVLTWAVSGGLMLAWAVRYFNGAWAG
jgi:Gpi18-like mannosyltransferase